MFTITGSTGQVGGAIARHLLRHGHPVRLLVIYLMVQEIRQLRSEPRSAVGVAEQ